MKTVYRTASAADAHIVSHVLAQNGVESLVLDEHIGPYGHWQGSIRVTVEPEDEARARQIIAGWESGRSTEPERPGGATGAARPSRDTLVLILGALALLAAVWYFGGR